MAFISFVRRISSFKISAAGIQFQNQNHNNLIQYLRFSTTRWNSDDESDADRDSDDEVQVAGVRRGYLYACNSKRRDIYDNPFLTMKTKFGDEKIIIKAFEPYGSTDQPCFPVSVNISYGEDYNNVADIQMRILPGRLYIPKVHLTQKSYSENNLPLLAKSLENRGFNPGLLKILKDCVRENGLINVQNIDDTNTKTDTCNN